MTDLDSRVCRVVDVGSLRCAVEQDGAGKITTSMVGSPLRGSSTCCVCNEAQGVPYTLHCLDGVVLAYLCEGTHNLAVAHRWACSEKLGDETVHGAMLAVWQVEANYASYHGKFVKAHAGVVVPRYPAKPGFFVGWRGLYYDVYWVEEMGGPVLVNDDGLLLRAPVDASWLSAARAAYRELLALDAQTAAARVQGSTQPFGARIKVIRGPEGQARPSSRPCVGCGTPSMTLYEKDCPVALCLSCAVLVDDSELTSLIKRCLVPRLADPYVRQRFVETGHSFNMWLVRCDDSSSKRRPTVCGGAPRVWRTDADARAARERRTMLGTGDLVGPRLFDPWKK